MLPSWSGSTAASSASPRQRSVNKRAVAEASPLTYLSNHAVVYQAIMSAPRRVAPKAGLEMNEKSRCEPPRMISSPLSTPWAEYCSDEADFAIGSGSEVFGVGGRK